MVPLCGENSSQLFQQKGVDGGEQPKKYINETRGCEELG